MKEHRYMDIKLTPKQLKDLKPLFDVTKRNPGQCVILGQPNDVSEYVRFVYFNQAESRALKYIITGIYDE